MNVQYVNAFLEAAGKVLSTMAFTEAKAGKPYVKKEPTAVGDVSALVGITGATEGSFCLSFTESCICFIVGNMFGEEITRLDDEVLDAVGELANIISGDARRNLDENGVNLQGAVPSVISGKNHKIRHMSKAPIVAIPFGTEGGDFTIELSFND